MMRAPNCCTRLNTTLLALRIVFALYHLANLYFFLTIYFPTLMGFKQTDPENIVSSTSFSTFGSEPATDEKKAEDSYYQIITKDYQRFVEAQASINMILTAMNEIITMCRTGRNNEILWPLARKSMALETIKLIVTSVFYSNAAPTDSPPYINIIKWCSPAPLFLGFFSNHATYQYAKASSQRNEINNISPASP